MTTVSISCARPWLHRHHLTSVPPEPGRWGCSLLHLETRTLKLRGFEVKVKANITQLVSGRACFDPSSGSESICSYPLLQTVLLSPKPPDLHTGDQHTPQKRGVECARGRTGVQSPSHSGQCPVVSAVLRTDGGSLYTQGEAVTLNMGFLCSASLFPQLFQVSSSALQAP